MNILLFFTAFVIWIKRNIAMFLIAFMLGMSNVILEETRMVNDTRVHIEYKEQVPNNMDAEVSFPKK